MSSTMTWTNNDWGVTLHYAQKQQPISPFNPDFTFGEFSLGFGCKVGAQMYQMLYTSSGKEATTAVAGAGYLGTLLCYLYLHHQLCNPQLQSGLVFLEELHILLTDGGRRERRVTGSEGRAARRNNRWRSTGV